VLSVSELRKNIKTNMIQLFLGNYRSGSCSVSQISHIYRMSYWYENIPKKVIVKTSIPLLLLLHTVLSTSHFQSNGSAFVTASCTHEFICLYYISSKENEAGNRNLWIYSHIDTVADTQILW